MTIPIELYATLLLVIRLTSMTFIFFVLRRQFSLFRLPIRDASQYDVKALKHFRVVLFTLALIIFLGNIVPAAIDIITLLNQDTGRPRVVQPISIIYTMTASMTALISSYLIWRLYRLAADEKEITDLTVKRLKNENRK